MFFNRRLNAQIVQDEIARGLPLPSFGNPGDVAMDLPVAEDVTILPFSGMDVRTGVRVVPPKGYYFRVVGKGSSARRGLAFNLEIIDPGYRGEIVLHPWNGSSAEVKIARGRSIAQLELVKVTPFKWTLTVLKKLGTTARGEGRMDSTKTGIS